jgi:hypothetical protein
MDHTTRFVGANNALGIARSRDRFKDKDIGEGRNRRSRGCPVGSISARLDGRRRIPQIIEQFQRVQGTGTTTSILIIGCCPTSDACPITVTITHTNATGKGDRPLIAAWHGTYSLLSWSKLSPLQRKCEVLRHWLRHSRWTKDWEPVHLHGRIRHSEGLSDPCSK